MRRFRKICRTLHRELGFLAVGLTVVYALSGLAVNHAHHWDANYQRTATERTIEAPGTGPTAEVQPVVLERLAVDRPLKGVWRASDEVLQVFVEGGQYDVNLATGKVLEHGFARRPLFFDVNFMHLNSGKAPWTGIADAYAGILLVLALTGPWLINGSKGLKGRGGVMMAIGIVVPVVYGIVTRLRM
ncbi:MAG TPA: hypothetical protein PLQ13_14860 [Candidatus Krumholzibacteria bacterium]|nr:hypothetical protein [Candidatus Krumholzibacteria bacterium]